MTRTGIRLAIVGAFCLTLPGCGTGLFGGDEDALQAARQACNQRYPRRVGNYAAHARCVNQAVEDHALPAAPYPDLIRLQEKVRLALSERIDRRRLTPEIGERRMAEADRMIDEATEARAAADEPVARARVHAVDAILRR